jgi:uncharacterized protein YrzB (UPF0473 family)
MKLYEAKFAELEEFYDKSSSSEEFSKEYILASSQEEAEQLSCRILSIFYGENTVYTDGEDTAYSSDEAKQVECYAVSELKSIEFFVPSKDGLTKMIFDIDYLIKTITAKQEE